MKYKKIIFVCAGNTCRSPLAEAVLKEELKKQKIRWYKISSAGLRATAGAPMSENSKEVLTEAGIAFSPVFRARRLAPKMVDDAYAVVCMTWDQMKLFDGATNVTCMYELAGRDIPDPYGQSADVYRVTLRAIRECMPALIRKLEIKKQKSSKK